MISESVVRIGFLGYGTRALDALMADSRFDVRYFLTPRKNLCDDVYEAERKYNNHFDMEIIDDAKQLYERIAGIHDVDCFMVNACSIIIKPDALSVCDFYNIHPGRLETNRGHHPHLWTVLLEEKTSEIVLHKVTPGIDEGEVVACVEKDIPAGSNSEEVLNLLEDEIPALLSGLYLYLKGQKGIDKTVYGGIYRHVLTPEDYRVRLENSTVEGFDRELDKKMRARFMHHGAFFVYEGNRIYVDKIISKTDGSRQDGYEVILRSDNTVALCTPIYDYEMHINKIQADDGGLQ